MVRMAELGEEGAKGRLEGKENQLREEGSGEAKEILRAMMEERELKWR